MKTFRISEIQSFENIYYVDAKDKDHAIELVNNFCVLPVETIPTGDFCDELIVEEHGGVTNG